MLARHALLGLLGLLALAAQPALGSAIKGHSRSHEEARSIKLVAPVANNLDKPKQAPPVPILESTKKIYNDEAIRRLVAQAAPEQQAAAPAVAEAAPKQAAPVAEQPAGAKEAAVVERAKAAPAESVAVKPAEELPVPSVRSAQVVEQAPAAAAPQPAKAAPEGPAAVVAPAAAAESELEAKKEEAASPEIEVPAPDPGLVLSAPIDSTTKLLIDLDEHVQKFLPAEEQQAGQPHKDQALVAGVDYSPAATAAAAAAADPTGKSSAPLVPYSSSGADEPIVPPLPSLEGVEKASGSGAAASGSASQSSSSVSSARQGGQGQNQQQVITQLLDQLDSLQNRIQDTINQLVARRRYVMSALLRPMGTYVRRVRTNLERLQTRVNHLQSAAVSNGNNQTRPGGFVDSAAIETIRRRIDDISKRISDIVNRIRISLTPTSAPLNNNGRK